MNVKTATSILTEFCVQQKVAPPQYESVSHDSGPGVFIYLVKAFNLIAKGSGRTKKEAKQAASQQLIDGLSHLDEYKNKLNIDPPPPTAEPKIDNFFGAIQTLCLQHNLQSPTIDEISVTGAGSHKPEFTYCCKQGSYETCGTANTKKEAKRKASEEMLKMLEAHFEREDSASGDTSSIGSSEFDNFYGAILTLCLHHNLQSPTIDEISVTGAGSHRPEFTYCCKQGSYETYGTANTKKEAKRKASEEMLKMLEAHFDREDSASCDSSSISSSEFIPNVLPMMELPSVQEVLAEYRRLRKPYLQPVKDGLRDRKNFFLNLPAVDRRRAQQVLTNGHLGLVSAKEIVDQTFKALNLEYEIKAMDKPPNFKRFCLTNSKYDCVIIEHANKLFIRIINFIKTMLNIQNPAEPSSISVMNNNF